MIDWEREAQLRSETSGRLSKGRDAIAILIDFYEENGQPTRAELWRRAVRALSSRAVHAERTIDLRTPPDLMTKRATPSAPVDPRRNAMMWLLHQLSDHLAGLVRFTSYRALGAAFGIGGQMVKHYVARGDNIIGHAAATETDQPTMRATQRLAAAGALRGGDLHLYEIEIPPHDWPLTHRFKARPAEDRWKLRNDPTKTATSPQAGSAVDAASPRRASRGAKDADS